MITVIIIFIAILILAYIIGTIAVTIKAYEFTSDAFLTIMVLLVNISITPIIGFFIANSLKDCDKPLHFKKKSSIKTCN